MTSQLQRAVEVMDRLRSPGGCPWDAAQTHRSLGRYLLEETYETLEAIETDDVALLREELGDLLLQVLFHARLAEELPETQRFTIEDVAGDLVAKLIHRHPHVFGDLAMSAGTIGTGELNENWERLKAAEKGRASVTDGVPMGQPALALAAKLVARSQRAGIPLEAPGAVDGIGERLFALVREAVAAGEDPEQALRETARAYRDRIRSAEAQRT